MIFRLGILAMALSFGLFNFSNTVRADYASAMAAYQEGDYATALAELLPLAQRGEVAAQFRLGEMYFNGYGLEIDQAEAFRWYQRAAQNGHARAQLRIGSMLVLGIGTDQNESDAYYWLVLSALWNDGPLRGAALSALADVAQHLTIEEKSRIEAQARKDWAQ